MRGRTGPASAIVPEESRWARAGRTTIIVVVVACAVVLLYLLAAALMPRWWAQTAGNLAQESIARGTAWGLFFGFVFTLVPVLIIGQVWRPVLRTWKARVVVVLIALALALPNLLTLWVSVGTTEAVHAAQQVMNVRAPYFRGWTLVGAILGLALGAFVIGTGIYLRRRKRSLDRREQELTARAAGASRGGGGPVDPPPAAPRDSLGPRR